MDDGLRLRLQARPRVVDQRKVRGEAFHPARLPASLPERQK